jgi:type I restriction enzyme S subunit
MMPWPIVALEEVLVPISRPETLVPTTEYRLLGAHWYAEGLYIKDIKTGSEIQAKQLYKVQAGDFVYNRLFAWKGSFALASEDVDGCYVSNEFPCFRIKEDRLDGRYLHYYLSRESAWNEALGLSSGGTPTSRNRLKEDRLLAMAMMLPPLDEQRRILTRIEGLWNRITNLEAEATGIVGKPEMVLAAEEMRVWPNDALANARTLNDVTVYLARGRQSEQGQSEHYLIKTQHVQDRKYIPSRMTLAPHVASKVAPGALVQPSDILIACSAAGCLGRAAFFQDAGVVASTDTHVAIARANRDVVLPEYLYAYLRGAQGQFQLRSREKGDWQREKVGFRLTELNVADMRRVPVPIPGLQEQRKIVNFLERFTLKIDALRDHQTTRGAEIAALRPSVLNSAFSGRL